MKDNFTLNITPDGAVEGIYQDGLAETLDAKETKIERASNVEWEDMGEDCRGWVVRSAHDPSLAIRHIQDGVFVSRDSQIPVAYFPLREDALNAEVLLFWELLEKK